MEEEEALAIDSKKLLQGLLSGPSAIDKGCLSDGDGLDENFKNLISEIGEITDRKRSEGRTKTRAAEMTVILRSIRIQITEVEEKLVERFEEKNFKKTDFKFEIKKALKELTRLKTTFENLDKR